MDYLYSGHKIGIIDPMCNGFTCFDNTCIGAVCRDQTCFDHGCAGHVCHCFGDVFNQAF